MKSWLKFVLSHFYMKSCSSTRCISSSCRVIFRLHPAIWEMTWIITRWNTVSLIRFAPQWSRFITACTYFQKLNFSARVESEGGCEVSWEVRQMFLLSCCCRFMCFCVNRDVRRSRRGCFHPPPSLAVACWVMNHVPVVALKCSQGLSAWLLM